MCGEKESNKMLLSFYMDCSSVKHESTPVTKDSRQHSSVNNQYREAALRDHYDLGSWRNKSTTLNQRRVRKSGTPNHC